MGTSGDEVIRIAQMTGIEYIDLGGGTNTILVDQNDTIDFSGFDATNFLNVDYITDNSAHYNETIYATQTDDMIIMEDGTGNDRFYGNDGDDTFQFDGGTQSGDDIVDGGNGYDRILGTSSDDTMTFAQISNIELIDLGAGTDTIKAEGNGTLDFSAYDSTTFLNVEFITDENGNRNETIRGSQGDDVILMQAGMGSDDFYGNDGDDTFQFNGGSQNGSDNLYGGNGVDQIMGSAQDDTLELASLTSIEQIDLGAGTDTIRVTENGALDLSGYDNTTFLNVEYLTDNTASETLRGTQGDDTILVSADANVDTLYGMSGADTFLYQAARSTADTLSDFTASEGDAIDISQVLSYDAELGDLISDFVRLTESDDGDVANGAGSVTLEVDIDGTSGSSAFQAYAVFDDQGMSIADLISNNALIIE